MLFNAVFNSISVISRRPVHLTMLSWSSSNQNSAYFSGEKMLFLFLLFKGQMVAMLDSCFFSVTLKVYLRVFEDNFHMSDFHFKCQYLISLFTVLIFCFTTKTKCHLKCYLFKALKQNVLTLYQTTTLWTVPNSKYFDHILNSAEIMIIVCESSKPCWKGRKCWFPAFSPFPTRFSKGYFLFR